MAETNIDSSEVNWYRISVAEKLATFAIRAFDLDDAELAMIAFCKDKHFLGINPQSFDESKEVSMIEGFDLDYYRSISVNWEEDHNVHLEQAASNLPLWPIAFTPIQPRPPVYDQSQLF